MSKKYTFEELVDKTPAELNIILCDVQSNLAEMHRKRFAVCGRILFYQHAIDELKEQNDD